MDIPQRQITLKSCFKGSPLQLKGIVFFDTQIPSQRGLLLQGKICSQEKQNFYFKSNPLWEQRQILKSQSDSPWSESIHLTQNEAQTIDE